MSPCWWHTKWGPDSSLTWWGVNSRHCPAIFFPLRWSKQSSHPSSLMGQLSFLPHPGLLPSPEARHLVLGQVKPPGSQPSSQVLQVTTSCAQDSNSPYLLLALTKPSSPCLKGKGLKKKNKKHKKPTKNTKEKKIKLEKKNNWFRGQQVKRKKKKRCKSYKLENGSVEDWMEIPSTAPLRAPTTPWKCPEKQ